MIARAAATVALLGRSPVGCLGAAIVLFWAAMGILAPWLAPYPPNRIDPALIAYPYPTAANWLGVDQLGRDILSRLMWGARTVLTVAPAAVLGAAALGTLLGLVAGYKGGAVDSILMRVGDFYECLGWDAVLAIEHCGLNAMSPEAGVPMAGCQWRQLRRTLSLLVAAGFTVVSCLCAGRRRGGACCKGRRRCRAESIVSDSALCIPT